MSDWNEIFDLEWNVGEHARPDLARATFTPRNRRENIRRKNVERGRDIKYNLEHPHRDDLTVGELSVSAGDLPEWLIADLHDLFVRADEGGSIEAVHYPYETRYDTPEYGLFDLDPSAPTWVRIPAGTYSTYSYGSLMTYLWKWDGGLSAESAPPDGAAAEMTKAQPNDADVPIYTVPRPVVENRAVITSPDGETGTIPASRFEFVDRIYNPSTMKVKQQYAEEALADDDSDVDLGFAFDTPEKYFNWDPQSNDLLVVAETHPADDVIYAVSLRLADDGKGAGVSFEFGDHYLRIATSEDGLDAATDRHSHYGLMRKDVDTEAFDRGDVFAVSQDGADSEPNATALYGARTGTYANRVKKRLDDTVEADDFVDDELAEELVGEYDAITKQMVERVSADVTTEDHLRKELDAALADSDVNVEEPLNTLIIEFTPHLTAMFNHLIPRFQNFTNDPHPDNYVDDVPAKHVLKYTKTEDTPRGFNCAYAVGPPEAESLREHTNVRNGYGLHCERAELPEALGNQFTCRYDIPDDAYGNRARITHIWPDDDLLREYDYAVLEVVSDADEPPTSFDVEDALDDRDPEKDDYETRHALGKLYRCGCVAKVDIDDSYAAGYRITDEGERRLNDR